MLILREVLKWKASEVAELLDTTVVSVNSALQRARSTLAERNVTRGTRAADRSTPSSRSCSTRYVDAFERFDIESLVALLHEDATMQMPPYPLWMRGADEYRIWLHGPGQRVRGLAAGADRGQRRARRSRSGASIPTAATRVGDPRARDLRRRASPRIDFFVDPDLFPLFDLPVHLDA